MVDKVTFIEKVLKDKETLKQFMDDLIHYGFAREEMCGGVFSVEDRGIRAVVQDVIGEDISMYVDVALSGPGKRYMMVAHTQGYVLMNPKRPVKTIGMLHVVDGPWFQKIVDFIYVLVKKIDEYNKSPEEALWQDLEQHWQGPCVIMKSSR